MIPALSTENVSKYEFLTCQDVLPKIKVLEKASSIKRFEYLPIGKELKAQTSATKKQCQKLDKVFESNEKEEKFSKSRAKSILVYNQDFTFSNTTTPKNLLNVLFIQKEMI